MTGGTAGRARSRSKPREEKAAVRSSSSSTFSRIVTPRGTSLSVERVLGTGRFGVAHLVRPVRSPLQPRYFCLKEVPLRVERRTFVEREVSLMAKACLHPHVATLYEWWTLRGRVYMLMEHCANGSLDAWIREGRVLGDARLLCFVLEIGGALKHCHDELRILHRDIKPANILIDAKGTFKLTDFGLSKALETSSDWTWTQTGSPLYMAPEQLTGAGYAFAADVWALGCVMYELIVLHSPWVWPKKNTGNGLEDILGRIRACKPVRTDFCDRPAILVRVLFGSMLVREAKLRASMGSILARLWQRMPSAEVEEAAVRVVQRLWRVHLKASKAPEGFQST